MPQRHLLRRLRVVTWNRYGGKPKCRLREKVSLTSQRKNYDQPTCYGHKEPQTTGSRASLYNRVVHIWIDADTANIDTCAPVNLLILGFHDSSERKWPRYYRCYWARLLQSNIASYFQLTVPRRCHEILPPAPPPSPHPHPAGPYKPRGARRLTRR